MVSSCILNRLGSCGCLSIRDIMIGILKEVMNLINYIVILGKTYLWTCRCKGINPNFNHFKRILEIKYETEKYIDFKANKIRRFKKKWEVFEVLFNIIKSIFRSVIAFLDVTVNQVESQHELKNV